MYLAKEGGNENGIRRIEVKWLTFLHDLSESTTNSIWMNKTIYKAFFTLSICKVPLLLKILFLVPQWFGLCNLPECVCYGVVYFRDVKYFIEKSICF